MKTRPPFKMSAEEARLWAQLDPAALPRHVAIILDGNGRWARRRHQPRIAGHRAGVRAVRQIVEFCARMHLPVLTLFAFSLDNWKRPREEVAFLMQLLRQYVRRELDYMRRNNVRLRVIGRWRELPPEVRRDIAHALDATAQNTGLQVVVALNYSARREIVDAVQRLISAASRMGICPWTRLPSAPPRRRRPPDPDLLIRTSGKCASATSCSGRWPTPKSGLPKLSGRTSPQPPPQAILDFSAASTATAASRPMPPARRPVVPNLRT
jgi:undecaprenyl diphosphate synthase